MKIQIDKSRGVAWTENRWTEVRNGRCVPATDQSEYGADLFLNNNANRVWISGGKEHDTICVMDRGTGKIEWYGCGYYDGGLNEDNRAYVLEFALVALAQLNCIRDYQEEFNRMEREASAALARIGL